MSESRRPGMVREDWHAAADLVDALLFDEPDSHEQRVWNMALKVAGRALRRESARYPWEAREIIVDTPGPLESARPPRRHTNRKRRAAGHP